jgi:hypothetical protein
MCVNLIKHTYVGTKAILKDWKSGLLCYFGQFLAPVSGSAFQSIQIHADPEHWCLYSTYCTFYMYCVQ